MRAFTRSELITVLIIFTAVFAVTAFNMNLAILRSRDSQRRSDMGTISDALEKFRAEYGYFPPSENGKIKMCKGRNFDDILVKVKGKSFFDRNFYFEGLRECDWGKDSFSDLIDPSNSPYLTTIPSDPSTKKGYSYYYLSNTVRYQIYSYLEGEKSEIGYNEGIVNRKLSCGKFFCSYGKSYGATPLDKSIEEYEQELLLRQKNSGQ